MLARLDRVRVVSALVLTLLACGLPARAQTNPTGKAAKPLDQIEPVPQFPPAPTNAASDPVPQALRYLKSGQERFDEGLWADATTALERALKIDPNLVDARILLARTAMQNGNLALAQSHLNEALKARPRDVAIHQLLGEIAFQQRKLPAAIAEFRLALMAAEGEEIQPERVLAHLSLGMALKEEGYLSAAADQFEKFLDAIARPTPAMQKHRELQEMIILYRDKAAMMLAELQSKLGRHDKAVEAYRAALKEDPADREALKNLILALTRVGRHDEAVSLAAEDLTVAPDLADALSLLDEACKLAGQPDRATSELVAAARRAEDHGVCLKLCRLLADRGRLAEAAEVLSELVARQPDNLEAVQLTAKLRVELKQPKGLVQLLHKLLNIDIASYPAVEKLIADAYAAGLGNSIASEAAAAAKAAPKDPKYTFLLACDRMAAKDQVAAISAAGAALDLDEGFVPAAAFAARATLRQRRWEDAIKAADEAIDAGLNVAELHAIKGLAYEALEEHDKAEAAFLEAFRLDRKDPEPLFRLAESIERRGEAQRCEQLYRRILDDVDPTYVPARENLVRLLLNSRKTDRAREYFSDFDRLGQNGPAVERCRALLNFATSKLTNGEARLKKYREDLEKIIADYPGEAASHLALAMAWEAAGDMDKAAEQAAAAHAIAPDEIGVMERLADYHARKLEFGRATEVTRRLLEFRPRNLTYGQRMVRWTLCDGNFPEAAGILREIINRQTADPTRGIFVGQLVEVLRHCGRLDDSVRTAKDWLEASPEDGERRQLYLLALNGADRKAEAVEAARKWLAGDPTSVELRRQFLAQLLSARHFLEAQQRLIGWLAANPDDLELNRLLIRVFWELRDWDSAIEAALTGMEEPRLKSQYELLLALSYRFARRWDEAVEIYRRRGGAAGARTPEPGLIDTLIEAGRYEEAEKEISAALDVLSQPGHEQMELPTMLNLRRSMARVFDLTDRMSQAFQQLEEMFKILDLLAKANPGSTDIRERFIGINNDLGYTYVDEGVKLEKAEKMIRLALAEEPLNGAYIDSLGWAAYKRGRYDEAIKLLSLAILLENSDDAVMFDHLGDAHYRAGHSDDARRNWEKALELSSDDVFPPPISEDRRVHKNIRRKLKALEAGQAVETAPLAKPEATTQSAQVPGDAHANESESRPAEAP